jgi:hypothetical protein
LGYIYYLGSGGDTLTGTASLSRVQEEDGTIAENAIPPPASGRMLSAAPIAYSSIDHD